MGCMRLVLLAVIGHTVAANAGASLQCIKPTLHMVALASIPESACQAFCNARLDERFIALAISPDICFAHVHGAKWIIEYHSAKSQVLATDHFGGQCFCQASLTPMRQRLTATSHDVQADPSSSTCSLVSISERLSFGVWQVRPSDMTSDPNRVDCDTADTEPLPDRYDITTVNDTDLSSWHELAVFATTFALAYKFVITAGRVGLLPQL